MFGKVLEIHTSGVRLDNGALISFDEVREWLARQPRFCHLDPCDVMKIGTRVWYSGLIDGGLLILEVEIWDISAKI